MNILNLIIKIKNINGDGDWGLGIGDWGLGIGPNPQSPIPNIFMNTRFSIIFYKQ